jgi:cytochrome c553
VALLGIHALGAVSPAPAQVEFGVADAAAGRKKAAACAACHGPGGSSTRPDVPSLAGQPPLYTYFQLIQFREGRRSDPQMAALVTPISDTDMRDIAAYYAGELPAPAGGAADAAKLARGRELVARHHCNSCHLPTLAGQKHIPRLAGQQELYLLKQLRGFKAQTAADLDGTMTMAAQPLTEPEIEALAYYLARLP